MYSNPIHPVHHSLLTGPATVLLHAGRRLPAGLHFGAAAAGHGSRALPGGRHRDGSVRAGDVGPHSSALGHSPSKQRQLGVGSRQAG